jgi:choline dehydrogenase-like flavoprotein
MMGILPDGPFDWRYRKVPQLHCHLRRAPWPRGRTLGGSSSINCMIYIRGHAADYDHWAELGNKGWSYEGATSLRCQPQTCAGLPASSPASALTGA